MIVDLLASQPHYRAHLEPLWRELILKGQTIDPFGHPPQFRPPRALRHSLDDHAVLVASIRDLGLARMIGYRQFVYLEHGIGQSYSNDHPAYPGGAGRGDIGLFLSPNETAAARDRMAYPKARVEVVGCPRLDDLPARRDGPGPVVALSFHWECRIAPESRSAFADFRPVLGQLARRFTVIGHGHPKMMETLAPWYRRAGIEVVESFDEVCRRADIYVCDNSSSMFEFASTGRPVVVLNASRYRREVTHGLRFWEAFTIGLNVDRPEDLADTIDCALKDDRAARRNREAALDLAYAYRSGAGARAAAVVADWAGA